MNAKKLKRHKELIKKKNILHNNIPLAQSRGNGTQNVTITRMKKKVENPIKIVK